MKGFYLMRSFLGLCFLCLPVWGMAKSSVLPIEHWTTEQGSDVYFVRAKTLPMLDMNVVFSAGSAYDGQQWGVANFVGEMLGESTQTQDADTIAKAFDRVGAVFASDVGRDAAGVSLRSLSDPQYFTPAFKMLLDVLAHPDFTDDAAFARIQNHIVAEIRVGKQTPTTLAQDALYAAVYPDQPYGHPVLGTEKKVRALTASDLKAFYQRYYTAKNAKIILVGDVDTARAKQIAANISSALKRGAAAPSLALSDPSNQMRTQHIVYPTTQTTIMLGQVGINRNNEAYFPLIVGNYVLGGSPLNSILFKEVRNDRGLAYYAYSQFNPLRYRGPFYIQLKTKVASTQEALAVVRTVMKNFIANGPSEKALTLAQENLINSFPLSLATNQNVLNILTQIAFYQRPLNYLDTYQEKVRAVSREEVKTAFARIVHPDKMVLVTVGPSDDKKTQ